MCFLPAAWKEGGEKCKSRSTRYLCSFRSFPMHLVVFSDCWLMPVVTTWSHMEIIFVLKRQILMCVSCNLSCHVMVFSQHYPDKRMRCCWKSRGRLRTGSQILTFWQAFGFILTWWQLSKLHWRACRVRCGWKLCKLILKWCGKSLTTVFSGIKAFNISLSISTEFYLVYSRRQSDTKLARFRAEKRHFERLV